jgi:hypothetical protein
MPLSKLCFVLGLNSLLAYPAQSYSGAISSFRLVCFMMVPLAVTQNVLMKYGVPNVQYLYEIDGLPLRTTSRNCLDVQLKILTINRLFFIVV